MHKKVILLFVILSNFSFGTEIYFSPSSDCENLIIREISKAKTSIDIVIYLISNKNIGKAIIEKNKEIPVKMILDNERSAYKDSIFKKLKENNVNIMLSDPKVNKIEHNKFTIIDSDKVITGSYNYTYSATNFNSENCILIEDKEHKFKKRFEELWIMYK